MNAQQHILERLNEICSSLDLDDTGDIRWEDGQLLRQCTLRAQRGDPSGWQDFMTHVSTHFHTACGFIRIFEDLEWAQYSVADDCLKLTLPAELVPIDDALEKELLLFLNPSVERPDALPTSNKKRGAIMYIEQKPGLAGHARIGRVTFSATRKTIYYDGRKLQSLKGNGYKANYYNVDTGLEYWISNCSKKGNDTLYPGVVEIDDDVRVEYWTSIRRQPQHVHLSEFRSEGKYSRRRPS